MAPLELLHVGIAVHDDAADREVSCAQGSPPIELWPFPLERLGFDEHEGCVQSCHRANSAEAVLADPVFAEVILYLSGPSGCDIPTTSAHEDCVLVLHPLHRIMQKPRLTLVALRHPGFA